MKYLFFFLALSCFVGCSNDDDEIDGLQIIADNDAAIIAYIDANNITNAQSTESGLYYVIEEEGNGTFPTPTSDITVLYSGYNLDGEVFDETADDDPADFGLNGTIPGFQEGLQKFSEGGSGRIFIPAQLAYGLDFPSFAAPIIFDVELLEVN